MRKRSITTTLILLLVGVGLSGLLSWLVYQRVMEPARIREDAFAAYLDGRLRPDDAGVIVLPAEWAKASADGRMYVTRESTGTRWALFVMDKGMGAGIRGYAFCDHPAAARVATDVELNYPQPRTNAPGAASRPGRETVIPRIKRVVNPSCFEVSHENEKR